jgi:hypothetical protein
LDYAKDRLGPMPEDRTRRRVHSPEQYKEAEAEGGAWLLEEHVCGSARDQNVRHDITECWPNPRFKERPIVDGRERADHDGLINCSLRPDLSKPDM